MNNLNLTDKQIKNLTSEQIDDLTNEQIEAIAKKFDQIEIGIKDFHTDEYGSMWGERTDNGCLVELYHQIEDDTRCQMYVNGYRLTDILYEGDYLIVEDKP